MNLFTQLLEIGRWWWFEWKQNNILFLYISLFTYIF